jgi:valyl-tRNA synthetase
MKLSKSYEPAEFEADIYALWESSGAFKPTTNPNSDPYVVVMPPPNANGNLHIGHGLGNALQDILIRYHRLKGYNTWYIPGADHAGFETWVVYEKDLEKTGKSRFDFTRDELYQGVWDFVAGQRGNMELQLRALGASCDWDSQVFTLDKKVVDTAYDTFEKMWRDGLIYRGNKLVNFCPKHQTAFADIEVVHKEDKGTLWSISYPLADDTTKEIIISTTRPETLLGDTAVAVHPNDPRYKDLIGKKLKLPLTDREIPLISDEYADPAFGTGAVKITPAHDHNDFEVGERHGLEQITVINFDDTMSENTGKYAGLPILEARKQILKDLEQLGLLRGEEPITHSVAHCYKCDSVLEPLLMSQWFISVKPLAEKAIAALQANQIKFYPANKKKVLINYFKNLKDWNISRQIPWGIPIPAFQNTADPTDWIFSPEVTKKQIKQDGKTYVRDEDTFDTWFSSGQWPYITTDYLTNKSDFYPLSVMETAGDILFAWVARMVMFGLYRTDKVPFKDVYLHGLVLDPKGQKMSKSKGNVVNPLKVIGRFGSDAFRLGIVASRSAAQNQAFSESKVLAGRNLCNKLWNISRFIQQIVDDSEAKSEDEKITTLNMSEDWIVRELNNCDKQLEKLLKSYRFAEATELLYDTIWNKYADWFVESQKVFKNVPLLKSTLEHVLIMLHPFAPFVTETIWQTLSWTSGLLITQEWPTKLKYDPITAENFETIRIIVSETRNTLSALKTPQEAILSYYSSNSLVEDNRLLIKSLSKVSAISATDNPKGLHLLIPNHELYLDLPEEVLKAYKTDLEAKILNLAKEIDTLSFRLSNENYTKKAPKELVQETQNSLTEKSTLLDKLRSELATI